MEPQCFGLIVPWLQVVPRAAAEAAEAEGVPTRLRAVALAGAAFGGPGAAWIDHAVGAWVWRSHGMTPASGGTVVHIIRPLTLLSVYHKICVSDACTVYNTQLRVSRVRWGNGDHAHRCVT